MLCAVFVLRRLKEELAEKLVQEEVAKRIDALVRGCLGWLGAWGEWG